MVFLGEEGNEVSVLVGGIGETMEKEEDGAIFGTGGAVEDGYSVGESEGVDIVGHV